MIVSIIINKTATCRSTATIDGIRGNHCSCNQTSTCTQYSCFYSVRIIFFINVIVAGPIYWIALSNKRNQSSWEWATSHRKLTTTSYRDWASGEPNNYGGHGQEQNHEESCVAMDNDAPSHHGFQWADIECYKPELYLCEAQ